MMAIINTNQQSEDAEVAEESRRKKKLKQGEALASLEGGMLLEWKLLISQQHPDFYYI